MSFIVTERVMKSTDLKRDSNPASVATRRKFLLGAGAATTGAAAVILTAGQTPTEPALTAKPDTKGKGGGYHVTEHVKHYYRTTLV
jgi:bifunctional ADP-heptose synthase (sugar kinase/adenylyltransferase)